MNEASPDQQMADAYNRVQGFLAGMGSSEYDRRFGFFRKKALGGYRNSNDAYRDEPTNNR